MQSRMGVIILENMEFFAYHGCFEQERTVGTKYVVSVTLHLNLTQAILTDNLNDTVNYQVVYDIIKKEMEIPSNLIEHVAGRIVSSIKKQCPTIEKVNLRLSKYNPPLGGQVEKVTIEL